MDDGISAQCPEEEKLLYVWRLYQHIEVNRFFWGGEGGGATTVFVETLSANGVKYIVMGKQHSGWDEGGELAHRDK